MRRRGRVLAVGMTALILSSALVLMTPLPAHAFVHEIIAALCREGGEEVVPPGQAGESNGESFVRALQGTGFIESIDTSVPGQVTVNFDVTVPASKFISAGFDLVIDDGAGPGVDLILSPLPVPDPSFPAHAACRNLNP